MDILKIENGILVECDEMAQGQIIIPDTVSVIGEGAFAGCKKILSVILPDSVIEISEGAFYDCDNLNEIQLSSGLKRIETEAFSYCRRLKAVRIPSTVEYIGEGIFGDCHSLEHIYVDPENLYYYSEGNCIIEKYSETLIAGCKTTKIPYGVTRIGAWAFSGCMLRSIDLPGSVTEICGSAFCNCISLRALYIPSSINHIDSGAFSHCVGLETICVDPENERYDSREDCNGIVQNDTLILGCKNTVIPESVTVIGSFAFDGSDIRYLDLSHIRRIEEGAFRFCRLLKEASLPNVDDIPGFAFASCESMAAVNIPYRTQVSRTAFIGCKCLKGISFIDE